MQLQWEETVANCSNYWLNRAFYRINHKSDVILHCNQTISIQEVCTQKPSKHSPHNTVLAVCCCTRIGHMNILYACTCICRPITHLKHWHICTSLNTCYVIVLWTRHGRVNVQKYPVYTFHNTVNCAITCNECRTCIVEPTHGLSWFTKLKDFTCMVIAHIPTVTDSN